MGDVVFRALLFVYRCVFLCVVQVLGAMFDLCALLRVLTTEAVIQPGFVEDCGWRVLAVDHCTLDKRRDRSPVLTDAHVWVVFSWPLL